MIEYKERDAVLIKPGQVTLHPLELKFQSRVNKKEESECHEENKARLTSTSELMWPRVCRGNTDNFSIPSVI